jgi:CheY-like chemotaxis protein
MPPLQLPLHILVVDDKFEVARALARALRSVARVDFDQSAIWTLHRLRNGDRYDLLVCDVNMRELSGVDLYERIIAEFPQVRDVFVFASGGVEPGLEARARSTGRPCLRKPLECDELLALVPRRP